IEPSNCRSARRHVDAHESRGSPGRASLAAGPEIISPGSARALACRDSRVRHALEGPNKRLRAETWRYKGLCREGAAKGTRGACAPQKTVPNLGRHRPRSGSVRKPSENARKVLVAEYQRLITLFSRLAWLLQ